jgi:lipopolysaccharide/colanic/teichoic acid biosynthesis glycosyltransferase
LSGSHRIGIFLLRCSITRDYRQKGSVVHALTSDSSLYRIGIDCAAEPPRHGRGRMIEAAAMRTVDIVGASGALLFLLPLFVLVSILVRLTSRGSVFFGQQRIGRDGRMFTCYKFRSMAVDAEQRLQDLLATDAAAQREWLRDHKLKNDPRITPIGGFLRKSSLDELPQFLNVLKGEMSLVGPRPIVTGEIPRYGRYLRAYASVKPGLTGLWQISGRSDTSYRRRVALDVAYARSKSLRLDIRILLATVPAVVGRRG